jgi:hypothetical protein
MATATGQNVFTAVTLAGASIIALSSRIVPHPHNGELNGQVDDTTSRAGYARFQRTGCNLEQRPATLGRLKREPLLRNRHAKLVRRS